MTIRPQVGDRRVRRRAAVAAAALSGRARTALVGARGFTDSSVAPGGFPKTLRGPRATSATLARPPRRIVSTYLGADEVLAALVDAIAWWACRLSSTIRRRRIARVYPAAIRACTPIPRRSSRWRPIWSALRATRRPMRCAWSSGRACRSSGGRGSMRSPTSGRDPLLGAAVGEEARAEALAGGVETLLADLERRLAGVRRVRVLYYDPPTFTMGRGTLLGRS
jgi:hypothetical protein